MFMLSFFSTNKVRTLQHVLSRAAKFFAALSPKKLCKDTFANQRPLAQTPRSQQPLIVKVDFGASKFTWPEILRPPRPKSQQQHPSTELHQMSSPEETMVSREFLECSYGLSTSAPPGKAFKVSLNTFLVTSLSRRDKLSTCTSTFPGPSSLKTAAASSTLNDERTEQKIPARPAPEIRLGRIQSEKTE